MSTTAHGYHCAPTPTLTTFKEAARSETSLAEPPTSGGVVGRVANPPFGGVAPFRGSALPFAYAYLNNLLIASTSVNEHQAHLTQVLKLSDHELIINPTKCIFGASELDFLGYRVTAQGIRPLKDKVSAV